MQSLQPFPGGLAKGLCAGVLPTQTFLYTPPCCPTKPVPSSAGAFPCSSLSEEGPRGNLHKECLVLKGGTSQGTEQALCRPRDLPLHMA